MAKTSAATLARVAQVIKIACLVLFCIELLIASASIPLETRFGTELDDIGPWQYEKTARGAAFDDGHPCDLTEVKVVLVPGRISLLEDELDLLLEQLV